MPLITPDTSGMIDTTPIAPGTYEAKVASVTVETAKSSGNLMVVPVFDVVVEGKPRTRKSYLVIAGEGSGGLDQLLRACNFTELADKVKGGDKTPFDTDIFIGQELHVIIEHELYNGSPRDRIRTFLRK